MKNKIELLTKEVLKKESFLERENLSLNLEQNMKEVLKMIKEMDLVFTNFQKKTQMTSIKVTGRMASNPEMANLSLNLAKNTGVTLKMAFLMDLVFTLFPKKAELPTMKVFGRMTRDQERANLFSKMETYMRETLKIT